jgi:hypothetical protein
LVQVAGVSGAELALPHAHAFGSEGRQPSGKGTAHDEGTPSHRLVILLGNAIVAEATRLDLRRRLARGRVDEPK